MQCLLPEVLFALKMLSIFMLHVLELYFKYFCAHFEEFVGNYRIRSSFLVKLYCCLACIVTKIRLQSECFPSYFATLSQELFCEATVNPCLSIFHSYGANIISVIFQALPADTFITRLSKIILT